MIDAKLIRSEPDRVREALARRGAGDLVDAFLELDGERRRLQAAVEGARAANNAAAKAIAEAKQKGEDTSIPIARQAQLKAEQATDEGALAEITRAHPQADAAHAEPARPDRRRRHVRG